MRVLVIDSDRWRELGIAKALSSGGGVEPVMASEVGERTLTRRNPAVVMLEHGEAITGQKHSLRSVRRKFPDSRIIIHGNETDPDAVAGILADGADGYFQLRLGPEILMKAIRVVARGEIWSPQRVIGSLVRRARDGIAGETNELTPDEKLLITLVHEGLTSKEIGTRMGLAEVTVKVRLGRLYRRFGVRSRAQLVGYVMSHRLLQR